MVQAALALNWSAPELELLAQASAPEAQVPPLAAGLAQIER